MAMTFVPCKACGTTQSSNRSTCRSCGADLATGSLPSRNPSSAPAESHARKKEAGMKQLHPKAIWMLFPTNFLVTLLIIVVIDFICLLVLIKQQLPGYKFMFYLNFMAGITLSPVPFIAYFWSKLSHRNYRYYLTDIDFRKEYGVVFKRYVSIPYDRIQNVDIQRGIIARITGLSEIQIQTAGMSHYRFQKKAEGVLPGLTEEEAENLRDELIRRTRC